MRLNLGAGHMHFPGWADVDIDARQKPERYDLRQHPWPWADDSAEEILASHILEHFTKAEGWLFLLECYRVLAPKGVLHVAVPDMDVFVECLINQNWDRLGGYAWTDLNHFMGGDSRELFDVNKHRYMYCFASLAWTLKSAGFATISRRGPGALDNHAHAAFSLYLDAHK